MNSLAKTLISFTLCAMLILPVAVKHIVPEGLHIANEAFGNTNPCKCVVFRFDDVQDRYLDDVQIKIMDLFLSRGAPLSLSLIMSNFGNDSRILNRISEGYDKGLFELALHGWEHKHYPTLSQQEQKSSLYKANERMQMIFGKRSDIFIPPYNNFNNATLMAIKELGIKILSSSIYEQFKFDQGSSILNLTAKKQNNGQSQEIFFLPYTTDFKEFVGTGQIKVPVKDVVKDIYEKIDKLGYAVVLIHPQSFIKLDKSGNYTDEVKEDVNQAQIDGKDLKDLAYLINLMPQKGIAISSFHKILNTTIR